MDQIREQVRRIYTDPRTGQLDKKKLMADYLECDEALKTFFAKRRLDIMDAANMYERRIGDIEKKRMKRRK